MPNARVRGVQVHRDTLHNPPGRGAPPLLVGLTCLLSPPPTVIAQTKRGISQSLKSPNPLLITSFSVSQIISRPATL